MSKRHSWKDDGIFDDHVLRRCRNCNAVATDIRYDLPCTPPELAVLLAKALLNHIEGCLHDTGYEMHIGENFRNCPEKACVQALALARRAGVEE